MIKCFWFSKLLKQSFIIWLIGFFVLFIGSFASAFGVVRTVWSIGVSSYNNSYQVAVNSKWNFNTLFGGMYKRLFMPWKWNFIYWSSDWIPYIYMSSYITDYAWQYTHSRQWESTKYLVCDKISADIENFSDLHCSSSSITENSKTTFKNFFSTVKNNDMFLYYWESSFVHWYSAYNFLVCVSSNELSSSYCFWNSTDYDLPYYQWITNTWTLFDSDRNKVSFDSINTAYLEPSPWWFGSDTTWPVDSSVDNQMSWDYLYQDITYWELRDYLENKFWYSKYLCYWWIDNFDIGSGGVSPIPWTWKNINEIQLNWINDYSWDDFFTFWNGLYGGYPDMWSSYPYIYQTWFYFYYQYGGASYKFEDVYNYCLDKYILQVSSDSKYKWDKYKWIKNNILVEKNSALLGSWDIVSVDWSWIWNLSGWDSKNAVVYIQEFFMKLKENFPTKYDIWLLFLPQYIIIFMLALILFRFISH